MIADGRIHYPEELKKAFEYGCVQCSRRWCGYEAAGDYREVCKDSLIAGSLIIVFYQIQTCQQLDSCWYR